MRIITGKARGLKLFTPKDYNVRPTTDRVKESLFNIISKKLQESTILDAFAGTGNLGLEAWSRGAKSVVFTDESQNSINLIKKNIAKAKAEKETEVFKGNVINLLDVFFMKKRQFDIIFSDPPYNKGWNNALVKKLQTAKVLKSGGLLVLEYSLHEDLPEYFKDFEEIRTEKYGETRISLILWK